GAGLSGEGIVAEHRPLLTVRPKSNRQVLTRARGRERPTVRIRKADGDHGVAFSLDSGDLQAAEPGPGRRRARADEASVTTAGLALEQRLERRLPARAERRNAQRPEQLLARMPGEVQEPVDFGDRHLFGAAGELDDLVSCLDLALLEHAEVEAWAPG